jgi:hypothetical protein
MVHVRPKRKEFELRKIGLCGDAGVRGVCFSKTGIRLRDVEGVETPVEKGKLNFDGVGPPRVPSTLRYTSPKVPMRVIVIYDFCTGYVVRPDV